MGAFMRRKFVFIPVLTGLFCGCEGEANPGPAYDPNIFASAAEPDGRAWSGWTTGDGGMAAETGQDGGGQPTPRPGNSDTGNTDTPNTDAGPSARTNGGANGSPDGGTTTSTDSGASGN